MTCCLRGLLVLALVVHASGSGALPEPPTISCSTVLGNSSRWYGGPNLFDDKNASLPNRFRVALRCERGGYLRLLKHKLLESGVVNADRGRRRPHQVCVDVVRHVMYKTHVTAVVGFSLWSPTKSDGRDGGFWTVIEPPARPAWVVTAVPGEHGWPDMPSTENMFHVECSEQNKRVFVHLRHAKSRAYLNCVDGIYVRAHSSSGVQHSAAQREEGTRLEAIECTDNVMRHEFLPPPFGTQGRRDWEYSMQLE